MPSSAFKKFGDRILEVKRLHSLCTREDEDYRIKKSNAERDEALLRGAHVLLCSHLEGYFEDLISDVIVKGVSAKGTETTDTFSLKGLSQALDRLAQDCRR